MDTKDFIVERSRLLERMQTRRAADLGTYPFRMMDDFGINVPSWARLALTFVARGGPLSRFLEVGLPLAVPFLFRKQMPFLERLVRRFFTPKS